MRTTPLNIQILKRKGASLIAVLIAMTVVSFFTLSMYLIFMSNTGTMRYQTEAKKMYYFAKSGVNIAESAVLSHDKKIFEDLKKNPSIILSDTLDRHVMKANSPSSGVQVFENDKLLPDNIKISVSVEYLTKSKANSINKPEKEGFLMLTSVARNTDTDKTTTLIKYLDPDGIKSEYQQ